MTTIAWDGKTLASDTLAVSGGYVKRRVQKIFRLDNGDLFAAAGGYDELLSAYRYLNTSEDMKPTLEDFVGLLIRAVDGKAYRLEAAMVPSPILEPFHALGSGRDFAMMAMHLGKTAREAVELAMLFDAHTGGVIESMELPEAQSPRQPNAKVVYLSNPDGSRDSPTETPREDSSHHSNPP